MNTLRTSKARFVHKNDPSYPDDAVHTFAENAPVNEHNENMLHRLNDTLVNKMPLMKSQQLLTFRNVIFLQLEIASILKNRWTSNEITVKTVSKSNGYS